MSAPATARTGGQALLSFPLEDIPDFTISKEVSR